MANDQQPGTPEAQVPQKESIDLNNFEGDIDVKKALKAHSADTPEDLSKALMEALG